MESLELYLNKFIPLSKEDLKLLRKISIPIELTSKTTFVKEGKVTRFLYFLNKGIVRGFKNMDGKIVVEHLIGENNFLTSIDSFFKELPSIDNFETLTDCTLIRISKVDLELLIQLDNKWNQLIEMIMSESLKCKMERISDFQTLTAKKRYVKFLEQNPNLALKVSVENIASFLGIAPQSLSRIRKQISTI